MKDSSERKKSADADKMKKNRTTEISSCKTMMRDAERSLLNRKKFERDVRLRKKKFERDVRSMRR